MALPQYVELRGAKFQYRRAFPKRLWPATRSTAFTRSLRTGSIEDAKRSCPDAERRYWEAVDAAEMGLAAMTLASPLTREAARSIAADWFRKALRDADDFRTRPSNPDALEDKIEDAEYAAARAREALVLNDLRETERLAARLRDAAGFHAEPFADAELIELLASACVAINEFEASRLLGKWTRPAHPFFASLIGEEYAGPPLSPKSPVPATVPERTLKDLEAAYRVAKVAHLAPSSATGYQPVFRLLREVLGEHRPVGTITHEDGQKLFDAVQLLPSNLGKAKALQGLTVPEAVAAGQRLGLPTIGPKTVNDRYMGNLGAIFGWAAKRGWLAANPVAGMRVRDDVAEQDKRSPFGTAQLSTVFGQAPWTPRDATGNGKPIRYWGPLLGLFLGLRRAEVAGLRVDDIAEADGIPVITLRDGERRLKTRSSRRSLPVHPELIGLGLMDYVAERRATREPELFDGEHAGSRGEWGRKLGEWFIGRVRPLELDGTKLTFHSLRHDFKDALREAEVDPGLADYLMGHSSGGGVGATYGSRPSTARLRDAIGKVRFPGLALPGQLTAADETQGSLSIIGET